MRGNAKSRFQLNFTNCVAVGVVLAASLTAAGCDKLKARDNLNQGVNAFKSGNYSQAADNFKTAIALDPTFEVARLYLATAYVQQYIPGTDTPENKKYATAAIDEFQKVLANDPKNLLATQSMASLFYNMNDHAKALEWNKKVIGLDPNNKEAYYTLGVLAWQEFLPPDRVARNNEKMKPEDPAPLKDPKERAELKEKYWQSLTDGIESEKKAIAIDPDYDQALSYMNLLVRYRADLEDSKDQAASDVKEADGWMEKALQAQKNKAAKKAANPNAK
jgi:tetratricopeptide (TPR) repeat protein